MLWCYKAKESDVKSLNNSKIKRVVTEKQQGRERKRNLFICNFPTKLLSWECFFFLFLSLYYTMLITALKFGICLQLSVFVLLCDTQIHMLLLLFSFSLFQSLSWERERDKRWVTTLPIRKQRKGKRKIKVLFLK